MNDKARLDYRTRLPGYYPSTWPVECGGPRRQKLVRSAGPGLQAGEKLVSTTRDMGGWAVMLVQRGPGELFVQGGAGVGPREFPPAVREGDSAGWLERIDPRTLETIARSPDLSSGGHLWCGAVVVHENGDLYVANGRYCHRLNADCEVVAERKLPFDGPYNGLLILSDGNLLTKNLGHRPDQPCWFSVLEPEELRPTGEPFVIETPCMGRFSSDLTGSDEFVYTSSATEVLRLRYGSGTLSLDREWRADYATPGPEQSDGWDTCIGGDSIWMMDMGRPPPWQGLAPAPQRAFRFSLDDPDDRDVIDVIGKKNAWNPGPPLYDPERRILVLYDTLNAEVVALRYEGPGKLDPLWRNGFRNSVQMMLYPDTGELVLEDSPAALGGDDPSGNVVVVDVETGAERGRAPLDARGTLGMFLCPGFDRDFYFASLPGSIGRVHVD